MPSGASFLGSTPECLYTRTGAAVASEAVAGTRARGAGAAGPRGGPAPPQPDLCCIHMACHTHGSFTVAGSGVLALLAVKAATMQGNPSAPAQLPLPAGGDVEADFWLAFDLLRSHKDHVEFSVVRDWVQQVRQQGAAAGWRGARAGRAAPAAAWGACEGAWACVWRRSLERRLGLPGAAAVPLHASSLGACPTLACCPGCLFPAGAGGRVRACVCGCGQVGA